MALLIPHRLAAKVAGAAALALLLAAALAPVRAPAAPRVQATEAELKAAYLVNFGLFVTWPGQAFASREAPFVIAVMNDEGVAAEVDRLARTRSIRGRRISVARAGKGDPPPQCHVLYVSGIERARVVEILAQVRRQPVLTVSDTGPFCALGGGIRFDRTGRKLALFANPEAARKAGLKISPELLQMAEIRRTETEQRTP
jgi:hypothetical protein